MVAWPATSTATNPVYRITGVRAGLAEEQHERTKRYLISMGVRTACFLGAVFASGWLRWVLIAGALVLPYLAVVFANAGRERTGQAPPEIFLRPDRSQLPPDDTGSAARSVTRPSWTMTSSRDILTRTRHGPPAVTPDAMPDGSPRGRPASLRPSAGPRRAQPPIALIGRVGCWKSGSPMPWPACFPQIDGPEDLGHRVVVRARAQDRAEVGLLAGEQAVADLAVGREPHPVAGAAERPGHRADDPDARRAAVDQPRLRGGAARAPCRAPARARNARRRSPGSRRRSPSCARSQPCWASSGICSMKRST